MSREGAAAQAASSYQAEILLSPDRRQISFAFESIRRIDNFG
jgi:hypothetical protein